MSDREPSQQGKPIERIGGRPADLDFDAAAATVDDIVEHAP